MTLTPDFFKEAFAKGKSIRQISDELYVSRSLVSHIVIDYERRGELTKLDRCSVPREILLDIKQGKRSYYEVEQITGRSFRYLKRYVNLL